MHPSADYGVTAFFIPFHFIYKLFSEIYFQFHSDTANSISESFYKLHFSYIVYIYDQQ